MAMTDLTFEIEKAIKQYYLLDDERREYLSSIINCNSEITWSRPELIKALMLFNRAVENDCGVHDKILDDYIKAVDSQNEKINRFIRNIDNAYRASVGLEIE